MYSLCAQYPHFLNLLIKAGVFSVSGVNALIEKQGEYI